MGQDKILWLTFCPVSGYMGNMKFPTHAIASDVRHGMATALTRRLDLLIDGQPIATGRTVRTRAGEAVVLTGAWTSDYVEVVNTLTGPDGPYVNLSGVVCRRSRWIPMIEFDHMEIEAARGVR